MTDKNQNFQKCFPAKGNNRVILVTHGINYGGASDSLMALARAYIINKYDVYIFTTRLTDRQNIRDLERQGIRILKVDLPVLINCATGVSPLRKQMAAANFRGYSGVMRLVRSISPSIIHFNTNSFPHFVYELASRKDQKQRYLLVIHHREILNGSSGENKLFINAASLADLNIAITEAEAGPYGIFGIKCKILPNCLLDNRMRFPRSETNMKLNCSNTKILMGAQLSPKKGHKEFLDLAAYAKKFSETYTFHCYGVGPTRQERNILRQWFSRTGFRAVKLKLTRQIRSLENLKLYGYTRDFKSNMSEAAVYVRTATSADPWGRDVLEAISLGVPVVAVGHSSPYVLNGYNGILTPSSSPDALLEGISIITENESVYEMYSNNAYLHSRNFQFDGYCEKLEEALLSVTKLSNEVEA